MMRREAAGCILCLCLWAMVIGGLAAVVDRGSACFIDEGVPLSESHTFRAMDHFYANSFKDKGERKSHVPFFITSNPFFAHKYAQITVSYLEDLATQGNLFGNETVTILEAGGGTGQFTFHFINALIERWELIEDKIPFKNLRYIFNDLDPQLTDFVKNNTRLFPHLESGLLDTLVAPLGERPFDELATGSGKRIGGGNNPVVLIGNYVFDSIRADVFRAAGGVLMEGLVSNHFPCKRLKKPGEAVDDIDVFDSRVMRHLEESMDFAAVEDPLSRYSGRDADLGRLLEWYRTFFSATDPASLSTNEFPPFRRSPAEEDGATFLISVPAFRVFRELLASFPGGVLSIVADSGVQDPVYYREVFEHDDVTLANHRGEKAWQDLPVNLHAFERYFVDRGGFALHSGEEGAHLKVSLFVMPPHGDRACADRGQEREEGQCRAAPGSGGGAEGYRRLRHMFRDAMLFSAQNFNSMLDRNKDAIRKIASGEWKGLGPKATYKYLHSNLRMAQWDADVLYSVRRPLWKALRKMPHMHEQSVGMWRGLQQCERAVYPKGDDVFFVLGVAFHILGDLDGALRALNRSAAAYGADAVVLAARGHVWADKNETALAAAEWAAAVGELTKVRCTEYEEDVEGVHGEYQTWSEMVEEVRAALASLGEGEGGGVEVGGLLEALEAKVKECKEGSGSRQPLPEGTRVKARWKGRRMYPGTVGKTHANGFVQVVFDDGDVQEAVDPAHIVVIPTGPDDVRTRHQGLPS